jgi:hypothetical protein
MGSGKDNPPFFIRIIGFFCKFRLISCFFHKSVFLNRALSFYFPVDQTAPPFNAQAQIQLIVRKQVAT